MSAPNLAVLLDTTMEVETPEHVCFRYQVAGPARRTLAYLIDLAVRGAILFVLGIMVMLSVGLTFGLEEDTLSGLGMGLMAVVLFAVEWLYYVVSEAIFGGQTLGKRALRLRVVKDDGTPVKLGDSALRNLLRGVDFLPFLYCLGVVVMGRDRAFRRLGDLLAGTLVVHEASGSLHKPLERDSLPAWKADVLPELSAVELDALELFLRRRAVLSPARVQELAELVAPVLARRLGVRYDNPVDFLAAAYRRAVLDAA